MSKLPQYAIGDKVYIKGLDCPLELSEIAADGTGRTRYKIEKKGWFYSEDLIRQGESPDTDPSLSGINLQHLLSPSKFLPVYLSRINCDPTKLPPYSIELHLTASCNYKCYHCSYSDRNANPIFLKKEIIKSLIDTLSNDLIPCGAYFSGGGEPTTLKDWDKYIATLHGRGISVALVTNGSLIRDTHLETISKLTYIAISIYSTRESTYRKITGGNAFEVQFALPGKIKGLKSKTIVGARCVINEFNCDEITDIYKKAIDSGYDYVIFIPEIDYEKRGITLSDKLINELLETTSKTSFDDKRTNLNNLISNRFHYYSGYQDVASFGCHSIRLRTNAFVNYDGGVYLCQPHIGNLEFCIGNLNTGSLSDIWNGKQHLSVIEKLSDEYACNKCANCRSISHNKAVSRYLQTGDNIPFTVFKDSFL